MNIFIQIAIGFAPAAIFFTALGIFKKNLKVLSVVVATLFDIVIVASVVCGFTVKPDVKVSVDKKDTDSHLKIIYSMADLDDGLDLAFDYLDDLRREALENPAITLCGAYLNALKGDWENAKLLYMKANALDSDIKDEKLMKLCDDAAAESKIDFLLEENKDKTAVAERELKEYAKEMIEKNSGEEKVISNVASALVESEKLFDDYITTDVVDDEKIENLTAKINSAIKKDESLLKISRLRTARAKLMVLSGNYGKIAKLIDEHSSFEEIAIAAELYIKGIIKKSNFEDSFSDEFKLKCEVVYEHLENLVEKVNEEGDKADERIVKNLIGMIKSAVKNPVLYKLRDGLAGIANNEYAKDRPKALIEMAKIDHLLGNTAAARNNIALALGTVGINDDQDFVEPMMQISNIITDKNDTENLKDVATYVNDVISNTVDNVVVKAIEIVQGEGIVIEEDDEEESKESFNDFMGDYVNQKRVSINITDLDSSEFEKITARVSVDDDLVITAEQFKQIVTIKDCGMVIDDFTVEKVKYDAANIMLVCDVSGSMSGKPLSDLSNAVSLFANTATSKENIGLISFDDTKVAYHVLGTDPSVIRDAASNFRAGGGTNMYDPMITAVGNFSKKKNELNVILLLSDGEDNNPRSYDEICSAIGIPAKSKNVVVYTLGLGDNVNSEYMAMFSSSTGGEYLHVSNSATLNNFYEYLRSQIANQYIVTYKAKDTLLVNRELKIYLTEDELSQDIEKYTINADPNYDYTEETDFEYALIEVRDNGVYNLDTKVVFKSSRPTTIKAYGFGFEKGDKITVELIGNINYSSGDCGFVDNNTLSLTLPGNIALGEYDVKIVVDGEIAYLEKALSVVSQGAKATVKFGAYKFTAYQVVKRNGEIKMTQGVCLNEWLDFKGEVKLVTTNDARKVVMIDNEGSYIKFKKGNSNGFADFLAQKDMVLSFQPFGEIVLYDDKTADPNDDSYPVEQYAIPSFSLQNVATIDVPGFALYPNYLKVSSDSFSTELPYQEKLVKKPGVSFSELFGFEADISGYITAKSVDIESKFEHEAKHSGEDVADIRIGNLSVTLLPADVKIELNTLKENFIIELQIYLPFGEDVEDNVGFYMKWNRIKDTKGVERYHLSDIRFNCDVPIEAKFGEIPATIRDFTGSVKNVGYDYDFGSSTFAGSFDVEVANIKSLHPKIPDVLDKVPVNFNDTGFEFRIKDFYISVGTEVILFDCFEFGKCDLKLGNFKSNIDALGMYDVSNSGCYASVSAKIDWLGFDGKDRYVDDNERKDRSKENVALKLDGTIGLYMTQKFFGIEVSGEYDILVKVLVAKFIDEQAKGSLLMGFYDKEGITTFVIRASGAGKKGNITYYFDFNMVNGAEYGQIKV